MCQRRRTNYYGNSFAQTHILRGSPAGSVSSRRRTHEQMTQWTMIRYQNSFRCNIVPWLSSLGSRSHQNQPHEAWFDGFLALDPEVDNAIVFKYFEWSRIYFLGDVQNSLGEWKVLVLLHKTIVFIYLRQEPPRATMDAQRGSRSINELR